jgi:hypothetical protein
MKKVIVILVLLFTSPVWADTHVAADCEYATIAALIADAGVTTGDIISVPAGTCTWSTTLAIPSTKHITLQGSGSLVSGTVITAGITAASPIIDLGGTTGCNSRVTGFRFLYASGAGNTGYAIRVRSGTGWRIDNNTFIDTNQSLSISIASYHADGSMPVGVIYNNTFTNGRIVDADPDLNSHDVWASDLGLGTSNTVFVEGNTFNAASSDNQVLDANYGGRYVFRWNTLNDGRIEAHSLQAGNQRGTRSWEVYNNIFAQSAYASFCPFRMIGGTGVIFNNILTGTHTNSNICLDNVRTCAAVSAPAGKCDGSSIYDGNDPAYIPANSTGTHTAADGGTLTDSAKAWGADAWIGYTVYNTSDAPAKCYITGSATTTLSCTLSGGTRDHWHTNDTYEIKLGYPCRDQIGRSTDVPQWDGSSAYAQTLDPAYAWNNKLGAADANFFVLATGAFCHAQALHIVEGRDFINGSSKPGYSAYTCPHPLTGLTGSCGSGAGVGYYNINLPNLSGGTIFGGTF